MHKNLNATRIGLLTGITMIALALALFYSGQPFESPLQYIIYLVYAIGIILAVRQYSLSEENTNKFADLFLNGFKCFIVVTLLMVLFTFVFNKMHPEFKTEMGEAYRQGMVKKGNSTPDEINSGVEKMKSYYLVMLISGAVFSYLLMGGIIAAGASLLFKKRN